MRRQFYIYAALAAFVLCIGGSIAANRNSSGGLIQRWRDSGADLLLAWRR
jgi:hypothetical protein